MSCAFDPSTDPYIYRHLNGTIVTDGILHHTASNESICIFPTEACNLDVRGLTFPQNGSSFRCCEATDDMSSRADVWYVPLAGFVLGYIVIGLLRKYVLKPPPISRPKSDSTAAAAGSERKGSRRCIKFVFGLLMVGMIFAMVYEMILITKSVQQVLSPSDTAARVAMDAFLVPVEEIFAFLEDAMAIKVGYAIAAKRYHELNMLLHISVIGGLVSGLAAFGVVLALSRSHGSAAIILDPSADSNAELIAAGCTLVPTTDELLANAEVYMLSVASSWIPTFVMKGLNGFMIGATASLPFVLLPYFVSIIFSSTFPLAMWFGLRPALDVNPLSFLGLSNSAAPWFTSLLFLIFFACYGELRRKFHLRCLLPCCRSRHPVVDGDESGDQPTTTASEQLWTVVKEGGQLMLVDVAVQLSISVTIYVAAEERASRAFKLAAAQAAYWQFGPSYLVGLMFSFKLLGSRLVASGQHKQFVTQFATAVIVSCCLAVTAIVGAYMKATAVAFDFGESACIYRAHSKCAPEYIDVFDGPDSLSTVFDVFGPTVGLQLLFIVLRAGLAMCHDFAFLAKSACASVLLVFLPAIVIAKCVFNTSVAYWVAMYAPHVALVFVFGYRMRAHTHALWHGLPGPWTKHSRRMSVDGGGGGGDGEKSETAGRSPSFMEMGREPLLKAAAAAEEAALEAAEP